MHTKYDTKIRYEIVLYRRILFICFELFYSLDLSRVHGFKPCIFVCLNFLRYEKTHSVRILTPCPKMIKVQGYII
jgi:hypothetical protein